MPRLLLLCLLCLSGLSAAPAFAADPCPLLRMQTASADVATRVAAYACKENQDWFRPFIDADGRGSGPSVYEAENGRLADGDEAWRKVVRYWSESGLLPSAYGRAGASECAYAVDQQYVAPACRTFVVDTPWSGAFVSWVMRRAGLPGFRVSSSHIAYVRDAYRNPTQSPYLVQAPQSGKPVPGDLLCSVRAATRVYGFGDLATLLSQPDRDGLAMHCDIVVGATPGALAYLVGGNVQQAVTLRMLRLDARGYFSDLPVRSPDDAECSPDAPANCNSNRLDWAVMLKLKPAAELARLAQPWQTPAPQDGGAASAVSCGQGAAAAACVPTLSMPQTPPPPADANGPQ